MGPGSWSHRVLKPFVPQWAVAQRALEVVRAYQRHLDVSGNGSGSVLSWTDRCWSPCHSQPAGDRGSTERLQVGASAHARSDSHFSSLAVAATGVRQGSRAPADQVVHLCCRGSGEWCHPPVHHLRSTGLSVDRRGWIRTRSDRPCRHPDLHGDRHNALQTLRDRPSHKPYPRLWFSHRYAGSTLLRRYRGVAEGVRLTHRSAVHTRSRGIHPLDSSTVHAPKTPHPELYRQALLPYEV